MVKKYIYNFGNGKAEGNASASDILGGKGANLAEICNLGLPVPPGFTISSKICEYYYLNNKDLPSHFNHQVELALENIEKVLDKKFGDPINPLLVSVRSGARASMPGMMDTILNLGLNDETVIGLATQSDNYRFAYDSYRRFIQMYSSVVLHIEYYYFEELLESVKRENNISSDVDLTIDNLKYLIDEYKKIVIKKSGKEFPQSVKEQLWQAIRAVFDSWSCARAVTYRKLNNIPKDWYTAVNIQSMVFGNMDTNSATGVVFTRNPANGDNKLYGEYLVNAQGEDVVAGIRTPYPITKDDKVKIKAQHLSLEEFMPKIYTALVKVIKKLEKHYRDVQDIEFTIEAGKLWILQTRSAKRTAQAALKIAVDLVNEKLISKKEALLRIDPESLSQLLHPTLDPTMKKNILTKGLPASPGAASGIIAFSSTEVESLASTGKEVILVRVETSPEDIQGMHIAKGILTSRGGMTSHAAVVARGMGKTCVVGAGSLNIDYEKKIIAVGSTVVKAGDYITLDGNTGEIILDKIPMIRPAISEYFNKITSWANEAKALGVRVNAETVADIKTAIDFGAEGIGLCRTEHMFFEKDRIVSVRKMIVARNSAEREDALKEVLPMQRKDFIDILTLMRDRPVNIRLLDIPLHEFLPHTDKEIQEVAKSINSDAETIMIRCNQLHEVNPMLGHRGSRLGITYPEIYIMQVTAILEAMLEVNANSSFSCNVEIMVPLIATPKEMEILKDLIDKVAAKIEQENSIKLNYKIGTMIELPRAALCSDQIADYAEYMSYGTNDLSQTTFGLSRDDSASFINEYIDKGIISNDPFVALDIGGVGELIKISAQKARNVKPNIKLGVCGEQGGHPASVQFFDSLNFSYISCSPYRLPIARVAAAQAKIRNDEAKNNNCNSRIDKKKLLETI